MFHEQIFVYLTKQCNADEIQPGDTALSHLGLQGHPYGSSVCKGLIIGNVASGNFLSAENLCKQLGSRSGTTTHQA